MSDDEPTGMWELLEAVGEALGAADPGRCDALAKVIDAYAKDFPDEFYWAISPQAPALLYHLLITIDAACRPSSRSKVRPPIRLVDRKQEGNAPPQGNASPPLGPYTKPTA
jgi:hypothetical protein